MKRIISVLLAVMLVASCAVMSSAYSWDAPEAITVDQAVAKYEATTGEEVATNRYYFLMPNGKNGELGDDTAIDNWSEPTGRLGEYAPTWYMTLEDGTPATSTAGIYWWDSNIADPEAWFGYLPSGKDEADPDVYYADVPQEVTALIWNNAVDGGMDDTLPIYYCAAQSVNIGCEYYDPDESPNYPDGTESFDNMIFVIDPDLISVVEFSGKQTCGGEWYFYYGNGCYGFTKDGTEADCLRDDHYDTNGNHTVSKAEKPTTTPTTEVPETEATEPPTNAPTTDSQYIIAEAVITDPSKINGTVHGYMGDADGDSESSVMDATEIQLCIARLKTMDEIHTLLSDVDRDGEVSVMDATEIQLFIAKLKTSNIIGRILYTPVSTEPPTEKPLVKCDRCNTTVLYPYSYGSYNELCYSCYYDMIRQKRCDRCNTTVSNPYSYGSYDELCYSCYYDLKNPNSSSRCDNCGTYVSNPYRYDGYDLCYSCYNIFKDTVKCYYCGDRVTSYKYMVISGSYKYVCYPCYNNKIY